MCILMYMSCTGNHEASCDHQGCEWYSKNFTAYNYKFRMPGLGANGSSSAGNMWYSLDHSYAHFVSFSAETDEGRRAEKIFSVCLIIL